MNCSSWIKKPRLVILPAILVLGVWLNGCGQESGLSAPAMPKIYLQETSHDFGKVSEEQELVHTFVMENTGKASLVISNVINDCKCTVSRYDRVIPPGERREITLTIQPYSIVGHFQKHTRVMSNDPGRPEAVLVLQGFSQRNIEFVPSRLIRLWGNPKEDLRGQVRIISHLPMPLKIKEVRTDIPDKIEVSLDAEEPGRVYVLKVRNKHNEADHYIGKIELLTTAQQHPNLILRVAGYVSPNCNTRN
jgi:hypothetical protein